MLMVLVMVLSLAACSKEAPEATKEAAKAETSESKETTEAGEEKKDETEVVEEDPLHFVYVSPLLAHPVWLIAKDGFDKACEELGVVGDWVGPQNVSPEEMTKLVETAVAQNADAIITQGLVPASPVDAAIKAGIPTLIVDSDIADVERLAFFGKDVQVQAELFYSDMVSKLGENTKINVSMQVAALNYQIAHDQINAIEEILKSHPGGYEVVSISESKSDKMKALTEWENSLKAYPEINVCVNLAAEAGPACANVVKEMDKKDEILVYAVDDIEETLALIDEGLLDGTVVTSFFNYGYQSAYWLYQHITEGLVPDEIINDAGTILVTAENKASYFEQLQEKKVDLK